MATADPPAAPAGWLDRLRIWAHRRIADPGFQAWATRFPLTRPLANRQGARLFDLVSGFVYSQVLLACVRLDLFRLLDAGPRDLADLSAATGLDLDPLDRLVRAAAALDLVRLDGRDRVRLGPLGAALLGAPGVAAMVRHHPMFYRDLEDPIALLTAPRGQTELARFWSYVGTGAAEDAAARDYSALMAASQRMVAAETLAVCPLHGVRRLLDVGGGAGAFLIAALRATPGLSGSVFDLPAVADQARAAFGSAGLEGRADAAAGSFLTDPLPRGADAISLIRVLYDHDDAVVRRILAAAHAALPPGGRIIVSEPMAGGARPSRAGDAYFGLYTAAMTSGRPRAPETHAEFLADAGFARPRILRPRQGFVTRVVTARKPGA
ncbi:MAG: methyltransferase [Pseudomonadota bacterium]